MKPTSVRPAPSRSLGSWLLLLAALGLSQPAQAQTTLDTGHVDIGVGYELGQWDLHVHKELPAPDEEFDPADAILRVKAAARIQVPADPALAFLGQPGAHVWVLPKVHDERLLFLGLGTEELEPSEWTGKITLRLRAVDGPGAYCLWDTDSFGQPTVSINTADGLSETDSVLLTPGSHGHFFHGFTVPGRYMLTFQASGTHVTDGTSASEEVAYTFEVEPVSLIKEHVDIGVHYRPEATPALQVLFSDDDHGLEFKGTEAVVVVPEAARLSLPDGTPFGPAGAPLWVLPQSQNEDLLYLGLSAEGVPPGVFEGHLQLTLKAADGPGAFYLWQSEIGGLSVRMNTADGITPQDATSLIVGSHEHLNWGFSTSGVYRLTFQASGQRLGETTNTVSADTVLTFHVLPLPAAPATLRLVQLEASGAMQLEIQGSAGSTYAVEASSDLEAWTPLQPVTLIGTTATVTVPPEGLERFVRAVAR